MGNRLIFPASASTYKAEDISGLFWVPADLGITDGKGDLDSLEQLEKKYHHTAAGGNTEWIPAQYFPSPENANGDSLIIYFHGNSCDLGDMVDELSMISKCTGLRIVHMEYPGYGICTESGGTDPHKIDLWGRALATFLVTCGLPPERLLCMGRSIGTGAAARLATHMTKKYGKVGGLILHSPYISIHEIVTDYAWRPATMLVANFWDTEGALRTLESFETPLLVIHGQADRVISARHGLQLYEHYNIPSHLKMGVFPEKSQHNCYNVVEDLVNPIREFVARINDTSTTAAKSPSSLIPAFSRSLPLGMKPPPPAPPRSTPRQSSSALGIRDSPNRDLGIGPCRMSQHNPVVRVLLCDCASPPQIIDEDGNDEEVDGMVVEDHFDHSSSRSVIGEPEISHQSSSSGRSFERPTYPPPIPPRDRNHIS